MFEQDDVCLTWKSENPIGFMFSGDRNNAFWYIYYIVEEIRSAHKRGVEGQGSKTLYNSDGEVEEKEVDVLDQKTRKGEG